MRVCCFTITFQFSRLHTDASWPETCKVSLGYQVSMKRDRGEWLRKTDKEQRRVVTKKEKGRRVKTEGATWWKCSGEGEIKELEGEAGKRERKYWKLRRRAMGERLDNSAGEEEIHRGREIASVLQIQREIATTEGQDRDFNTHPKGTQSAALSHSKKHNYYLRQPLREWNKKNKEWAGAAVMLYKWHNNLAAEGWTGWEVNSF